MTFDDLKEQLKLEDEVTLLELLDLHSDQLVDFFTSLIEDKQEQLRAYYGETETDLHWQEATD